MFSKEESKKIREEFWTSFGKNYPHKWVLYNTGIKEVQLKFTFNNDFAQVSIDVYSADEVIQEYYFEKIYALRTILKEEYLTDLEIENHYLLPEGKEVSKFYLQLDSVNIHNKKHWPKVFEFFNIHMRPLEDFFLEYKDYIEA
ncbi:DUF4268 domain-containing protein [Gillisia hiemivivida]|jgi:hypothetical protein|uniref:DUF4268 domain-containing protein n=1 Tax=Gillisia hiemivivida TaxID=291190 RepID=A0A5C6ZS92_9FLAO|nr:DUF4268 domain-containing protein [Gillisia hiemivivida]TXD92022.1 DUF4268 domain-containing protein [Gillisia hiemivivida]